MDNIIDIGYLIENIDP